MTLTTASSGNETLTASLLALEDLTNRLTVLTLHAVAHPEKSPLLRLLLEDLSEAMSFCEEEMEVFVPRT